MMKNEMSENCIENNKGFSLVEVLVCVVILMIAIAPLMQSFSTSAKANARAQRMQDATSYAESIMEEVKSKDYSEIQALLAGGNIISEDKLVASANKPDSNYTATVTINGSNANAYSSGDTTIASTSEEETDVNVEGANIVEIPELNNIDKYSFAIISSKETNKYDAAAVDYFKEKGVSSTISEKEINIKKEYDDVLKLIKVTCKVTYKVASDETYAKTVYSGSFDFENPADGYEKNGSILLYYKHSEDSLAGINETIIINDSSNADKEQHNVYLIVQDENFNATTIKDKNGAVVTPSLTTGEGNGSNVKLFSNLGDGTIRIYDSVASDRILEIEVTVTRGEESVTLNSTKRVDSRTE